MDITQICITRLQDTLREKGYATATVHVIARETYAAIGVEGAGHTPYLRGKTVAEAFDAAGTWADALEPLPTAASIAADLGLIEVAPGLWREAA